MDGSAEQEVSGEVSNWLNEQGLYKYASLLNLNGYKQFEDCFELTADTLKQLGVTDNADIERLLALRLQEVIAEADETDESVGNTSRLSERTSLQNAEEQMQTSATVPAESDSVQPTFQTGEAEVVRVGEHGVRSAADTRSVIRVDPLHIALSEAASLTLQNVAELEQGPLVTMKAKELPEPRKAPVLISVSDCQTEKAAKHNVHVKVSDRAPRDEFSLEYRERCLLPVNLQIRTLGLGLESTSPNRKRGTVRVIRASHDESEPSAETSVATTVGSSATKSAALSPPSPRQLAGTALVYSEGDDEFDASRRPTTPTKTASSTSLSGNAFFGTDSAVSKPHTRTLTGYLTLLPGTAAGNGTFWAVFDGNDLRLFKNEKARISKRQVPLRLIEKVIPLTIDHSRFTLKLKNNQLPFDTPKSEESRRWCDAIDAALRNRQQTDNREALRIVLEGPLTIDRVKKHSFLASSTRTHKFGSVRGGLLQVYGSLEERQTECPNFEIHMELATVKLTVNASNKVDRTRLQLIDARVNVAYILSFESVAECDEWNKALQNSTLFALDKMGSSGDDSRSKTLSKIYENQSNRNCADCGVSDPEWASINLGIMICDRCAGCHRQLSVTYSKVQSVRLDTRIWTNTNVKIMTTIGNANANKFWEGALPAEFVRSAWTVDDNKRSEFVRNKYIEKRYCAFHPLRGDERRLGEELCEVIRSNDRTLTEAMQLFFSGASLSYETVENAVTIRVLQLARDKKRFLLTEFFQNNLNVTTASGSVPNAPGVIHDVQ